MLLLNTVLKLFVRSGHGAVMAHMPAIHIVPNEDNTASPYIAEAGVTEFKPLTTEFIKECLDKMRLWAGYEEGRGKEIVEERPELAHLSPSLLSYNFDYGFSTEGNELVRMIDDEFFAVANRGCKAEELTHIIGNALCGFAGMESVSELKSEKRQDVIDFLVEERFAYLLNLKAKPKLDFEKDPTFNYMVAKVGMACLDKMTELMLGKSVAAEVARQSEQEMGKHEKGL